MGWWKIWEWVFKEAKEELSKIKEVRLGFFGKEILKRNNIRVINNRLDFFFFLFYFLILLYFILVFIFIILNLNKRV